MNPIDDQINRLFRAAAQTQPDRVPVPAFGFETRVVAAWRAGRAEQINFWDMSLLIRGLIVASLIMVASFWPALTSTDNNTNPFAEFLQLTDSTVPSGDAP